MKRLQVLLLITGLVAILQVTLTDSKAINKSKTRKADVEDDNDDDQGDNGGSKGLVSESIISNKYTKVFTQLADKQNEKVSKQVQTQWSRKQGEGDEIKEGGERTRLKGISYSKQVDKIEEDAVMKALMDISKAQEDVGQMMGVEPIPPIDNDGISSKKHKG